MKAHIIAGCPEAPGGLVAGLPRRERIERTLKARGDVLVFESEGADTQIPDCQVLIGDERLHLCEMGVAAVEDRLIDSLRKSVDGLVSRTINRPLSLAITRRLMNTRISPNQVTVVTFVLGLASGFAVSRGSYAAGVLGAFLLQSQSVIDGIDGELARLRFQGSRLGQWLDTISDDLASLAFLIGTTVIMPHPFLRGLGIAGVLSFITSQIILYLALIFVYRSGDLFAFSWYRGKPGGTLAKIQFLELPFRHDFFCCLALLLALLGRLDVALAFSSFGKIGRLVALLLRMFLLKKDRVIV